jgi:DNA replication protein DnaC
MASNDNQELNELLKQHNMYTAQAGKMGRNKKMVAMGHSAAPEVCDEECKTEEKLHGLVQWTTHDGKRFVPASRTAPRLVPAAYEIQHSQTCGIYFEQFKVKTEGLIRFPQTNSDRVVREIQTFWAKEDRFRQYGLNHKRGIMLWGPPGSGKSCTIQLIMKDVIERNGIVIKFGHPTLFTEGMRILREIEPTTPAVILMEDIDSTLEIHNESEVLNILDGVDHIEKVVFLATTNYPERLGPRILNRPSRFDKRFKIGHPNPESRMLYFKHIISGKDRSMLATEEIDVDKRVKELDIDLDKWVHDTEGFSIAHLKELFVAVTILGDDYNEAIETLASMRDNISSSHEEAGKMGFLTKMGLGR